MVKNSLVTEEMRYVFLGLCVFLGVGFLSLFLHLVFYTYPNNHILIVVSLLGRSVNFASILGGFFAGWKTRDHGFWYGGLTGFLGVVVTLVLAVSFSLAYYSPTQIELSRLPKGTGSFAYDIPVLIGVVRLIVISCVSGFLGEYVAVRFEKEKK